MPALAAKLKDKHCLDRHMWVSPDLLSVRFLDFSLIKSIHKTITKSILSKQIIITLFNVYCICLPKGTKIFTFSSSVPSKMADTVSRIDSYQPVTALHFSSVYRNLKLNVSINKQTCLRVTHTQDWKLSFFYLFACLFLVIS